MNYKYKRSQIFGKKLEVPKLVLNEIYNKNLSFKDFIKYNLEDKIPTSCITKIDKQIVDRFGLEKAKQIDWELIDNINIALNVRDIVMSIEPQTEDINSKLYDLIKDKIKPSDYTLGMKKVYSDRLFDLPEGELEVDYRMKRFNNGEVSLKDIINNWNLYKNKDYPQLEKFFAPYTRAMVRSLKNYEIFLTDEEILQVYLDVLGKTGRKALKNKIEKFWK